MPLGAIGNIASGIGGALGSIFGQRSMPAVEQPQVTNISNANIISIRNTYVNLC